MTSCDPPDDLSIELGEIAGSEMLWRPRPNPHCRALQAVGNPQPGSLPVFLNVRAVEAMFSDAETHEPMETGGILVGSPSSDESGHYLRIVDAIPVGDAPREADRLTFTQAAWLAMLARREALYPDEQVAGWYHTHPGMRVFLSEPDLLIHRAFFSRPSDIAVVLDLPRREWGIFAWHGDCLELTRGFYLYGDAPDDGAGLGAILGRFAARTG
ncbi:MAG: Mov34/MPN/PAD-1 family protein [Armatimonadetes bacterium]|nr:Mov34/MPN/PAD-1 family protein [Armatimonadota bacterium]